MLLKNLVLVVLTLTTIIYPSFSEEYLLASEIDGVQAQRRTIVNMFSTDLRSVVCNYIGEHIFESDLLEILVDLKLLEKPNLGIEDLANAVAGLKNRRTDPLGSMVSLCSLFEDND